MTKQQARLRVRLYARLSKDDGDAYYTVLNLISSVFLLDFLLNQPFNQMLQIHCTGEH